MRREGPVFGPKYGATKEYFVTSCRRAIMTVPTATLFTLGTTDHCPRQDVNRAPTRRVQSLLHHLQSTLSTYFVFNNLTDQLPVVSLLLVLEAELGRAPRGEQQQQEQDRHHYHRLQTALSPRRRLSEISPTVHFSAESI